jgi:hypothetical protein
MCTSIKNELEAACLKINEVKRSFNHEEKGSK